jgi:MFS family permease
MIGYAIMQLLAGSLGEKFGEERFLIVGILGTSILMAVNSVLTDFNQMIIIRFITGLFGGMYYAPSNALITRAAAGEDRGKALGLVFSSGPASKMLVFTVSGILILQNVDWQNLFLFYGLPGILFTPLMILLFKKLRLPRAPNEISPLKTEVVDIGISQTLKRWTVLRILVFNAVMALAMWPIRSFLPVFFVNERGLTIPDASFLMNVANIAGILCMPIAGYVTDNFGFKIPSYIAMTITGLITILVPTTQVGFHTVIAFALWGLFGCMSGTAIMVLLSEVVPDKVRGTFYGILNFVGWIGGTIGPIVFGRIIDLFGFTTFFFSALIILIISSSIIATAKRTKSYS